MPKPNILKPGDIKQILLPGGSPIDQGTDQRYSIYVPSPEVIFQLGKALGSRDPGNALHEAFGFDGISIAAANNLYLTVGSKPKQGSKVGSGQAFIDIQGAAIFQTRNLWQQWSGHQMVLATTRSLSGFANERVMLYAGNEIVSEPTDQEDHGELQHNEVSDEEFNAFTQKLLSLDSTFKNVVLALNAIKALAGGFLALPTSPDGLMTKLATWSMGAYEWPDKIDGAFHPPKEDKHKDVVIFGEEGVSLITDDEIGLIAQKEVKVLGNRGIAMTTALGCGIEAGVEAKIFGGFGASIGSGGYTEVTAGRKLELAALMGPVEMKGTKIEIGNELEPPKLNTFEKIVTKGKIPQLKTKEVEVGALEKITLESKKDLKIAADGGQADEGHVAIEAKKKILVKADEDSGAVEITVGQFALKIVKDKLEVGHGGGRGLISIDKDGNLTLETNEKTVVKTGNTQIVLKDDLFKLDAGSIGMVISHGKISLG